MRNWALEGKFSGIDTNSWNLDMSCHLNHNYSIALLLFKKIAKIQSPPLQRICSQWNDFHSLTRKSTKCTGTECPLSIVGNWELSFLTASRRNSGIFAIICIVFLVFYSTHYVLSAQHTEVATATRQSPVSRPCRRLHFIGHKLALIPSHVGSNSCPLCMEGYTWGTGKENQKQRRLKTADWILSVSWIVTIPSISPSFVKAEVHSEEDIKNIN